MLPNYRTLDGFSTESHDRAGLAIHAVDDGATITVKTRYSRYRLVVLDRRQQLVCAEGGIFTEPTVVRISGATFGGSALKVGWILEGLRVEFGIGPKQIVSSPVQSVVIEGRSPRTECDDRAAA
jgi:hypothetical protein